jgi:hypothetical protein
MILSPSIHDAVTGLTYVRGDNTNYDAIADALNLPVMPGVASLAPALHWLNHVAPLYHGPELPPWKWIDPLKHP